MKKGKVPEAIVQEIPEELRAPVKQYKEKIEKQFVQVETEIRGKLEPILRKLKGNRREFALSISRENDFIKKCAFLMYDGKSIEKIIMKKIYPKNNVFIS